MAVGKNYIISFQATLRGNKAVISGLRRMEGQTKRFKQTVDLTGKAAGKTGRSFSGMAGRALLTLPVWFALRRALMGIIRGIRSVITANLDLQDGLARIRTVMQGTTESINAEMTGIKDQIVEASLKSSLSLKELSESFYFLKTAGLTADQASDAFETVTDAIIGMSESTTKVGGKTKDVTRVVAGIFNTMGKYILKGSSDLEKFTKITDVLTYTYSTQDVEIKELAEAYTKFAPYATGLTDSFTEIVTMLGFLNTRMLRSGRAGRLTGRAILQLTKNATQLASIFGITFDPDKPISFLKVIGQISDAFGKAGKLTSAQGEALQRIFETRGGVTMRLLIENFDELTKAIELANSGAAGFAKRMKEIRMNTIRAQGLVLRNVFTDLFRTFVEGAAGTGDFVLVLKTLNETLINTLPAIESTALSFGYFFETLSKGMLIMQTLGDIQFLPKVGDLGKPKAYLQYNVAQQTKDAAQYIKGIKFHSFEEHVTGFNKIIEKVKEKQKEDAKLLKGVKAAEKVRLNGLKAEKAALTHNINLLKLMGASQLDIAKYKLEASKGLSLEPAEKQLEITAKESELIEAQAKTKKRMVDVIQSAQLSMLKIIGASELEILNIQEKQLESDRQRIGENQYLLSLEKLRTQQALAIQKAKQNELEKVGNIALAYLKGDALEKRKIREIYELRQKNASQVAEAYKDPYLRSIIDKYFSYLNAKQQTAVRKVATELAGMEGIIPEFGGKDLLPTNAVVDFWLKWVTKGKSSVDDWSSYLTEKLQNIKFGVTPGGNISATVPRERWVSPLAPTTGITTFSENIQAQLLKALTIASVRPTKTEEEKQNLQRFIKSNRDTLLGVKEEIKQNREETTSILDKILEEDEKLRKELAPILEDIANKNEATRKQIEESF